MATRIEGNKTLRRTIEVYGIGEVQAALAFDAIPDHREMGPRVGEVSAAKVCVHWTKA